LIYHRKFCFLELTARWTKSILTMLYCATYGEDLSSENLVKIAMEEGQEFCNFFDNPWSPPAIGVDEVESLIIQK
jgi:hypothetical protein